MITKDQKPNNGTETEGLTKNPRFSDHFTKRQLKKETFKGVSMTVPDQNLSLKEMLVRFARGQEIPKDPNPIYGVDEELSQVRNLDKFERLDFAKQNQEYIQNLQNTINAGIPPIDESNKQKSGSEPSSDPGTNPPAGE